jgi:ABC-type multidrug transport system, ATPase component
MGEGKSTLLKICAGVLQPDFGWVGFLGKQYTRPRLSTLATQGLYNVAAQHNLALDLTVGEHFAIVERRFHGGTTQEVVEMLQLQGLMNSRCGELSGGERQRAQIGVAAARRPLCLLADEPFRGIDPISGELIGKALRVLAAHGCAVLITGHEVSSFFPFVDTVNWLHTGTTLQLGSIQAWQHDNFKRYYLGASYSQIPMSDGVSNTKS